MYMNKKQRGEHIKALVTRIKTLKLENKTTRDIVHILNNVDGMTSLGGIVWTVSNLNYFTFKYIGRRRRRRKATAQAKPGIQIKAPGLIDSDLILNILTSKKLTDPKRFAILREIFR